MLIHQRFLSEAATQIFQMKNKFDKESTADQPDVQDKSKRYSAISLPLS